MRKIFSLVIGTVLFSTILPGIKANAEVLRNINGVQAIQATTQNGWVQDSGVWYFYENGSLVKGWLQDNGSWYYLDPTSGSMKKDWQQINGVWYYLDPVYGYMRTSWQQINGSWYYLDPTNGDMKTGWQQINNKWYYLDPTYGYMRTGWQKIDGKEYYFWTSEGFMASDTTVDGKYLGKDGAYVAQTQGEKVVAKAKEYIGVPYVWNGESPAGFDCSGFTTYVYGQFGINIPSYTVSQLQYGSYVSYSNLQPGDLVFFDNTYDGPNPTHVGIYVGNNEMIHAGDNGVAITNITSSYWQQRYSTARRLL
jgi:hypothetical protein